MIPQTLAMIFTNKCNFYCDHCSVCAGPDKNEIISEELMKKIIDQAYYIPSIRVIVFTGGEPTLNFEQLKKGIKYAHEKGFVTRIVSNAWWAKSHESARCWINELVACGLNEINISYDDFHLPYLSDFGGEQNVINAVRVGVDMGLSFVIGIVLQSGAKITSVYLREVFAKEGISGNISYLEGLVYPLGRARVTLPYDTFFSEENTTFCAEAGRTLVVVPDGSVSFCCGHTIFTEARDLFIVNNLNSGLSLGDILETIQQNVLIWMFHLEGPESVLKELKIKEDVCNNCEACFYLGTKYKDKLRKLAGKKEKIFARLEKNIVDKSVMNVRNKKIYKEVT